MLMGCDSAFRFPSFALVESLSRVTESSCRHDHLKGSEVISQGEEQPRILLVESGELKLIRKPKDGALASDPLPVGILGRGSFLGDLDMPHEPSAFSALVISPTCR